MKKFLTDLYTRVTCVRRLVNRRWLFQLKLRLQFSKKIKVGFGPITSGENDLNVRKWRIDPIVNKINSDSEKYTAGIFFGPNEMEKFDIIVIVKNFSPAYFEPMSKLKISGKKFIYDIVDNPMCPPEYRFYYAETPEFSSLIDGFVLSNPLQETRIKKYSKIYRLIEHPVISAIHKKDCIDSNEIKIIAQGYSENLAFTKKILPIIERISKETGKKIDLIYHSNNAPDFVAENLRYVPWSVENCFQTLADADIAISVKDLGDVYQKEKPSTKIITFMAVGLPVICTPTAADELVITAGKNGYFVYNDEEWYESLKKLVKDAGLRNSIGLSAREYVLENFNIKKITNKYIELFDQII